jgi:hypothetical protein
MRLAIGGRAVSDLRTRAEVAADLRVSERTLRSSPMVREPQAVECSICEWRGRRIFARPKPCPSCGAKVDYRG